MPTPSPCSTGRIAIVTCLFAASTAFGGSSCPEPPVKRGTEASSVPASLLVEDPIEFFERLVDRYRELRSCREEVRIETITEDPSTDDPAIRSTVRVVAEIGDDRLEVRSSELVEEAIDLLGPDEAEGSSGATESDLRLLPHMRLRFSVDPLEGFGGSGSKTLRPSEMDTVLLDEREMVRVELRRGESGSPDASFKLFVDPESMLVERIEGEEWLPGGLHHQTTVRIEERTWTETDAASVESTRNRREAPSGDAAAGSTEPRV